jgi:hypothetical protein
MTNVEDLTPFFEDRCRMFVLMAEEANVAAILRRGPTNWWRLSLWDTRRDLLDNGQWFHGRIYPDKCDLSPDGKLFVYFAGQFTPRNDAGGYSSTWTAVSRPPYLTALALWPFGGTYGGSGIFLDNRTVLLGISAPSSAPGWRKHHPNHPPGPLQVLTYGDLEKDDIRRNADPGWLKGWVRRHTFQDAIGRDEVRKPCGPLTLARYIPLRFAPSRGPILYTVYGSNDSPVALFEAQWADWDQRGRLVATAGGRVFSGKIAEGRLTWKELFAVHEDQPSRMEAPDWAQHW